MALGGLVLGSLILYLKGMRIMMFQLSGFYCRAYSKLRIPLLISFRSRRPGNTKLGGGLL